MLQSRKWTILSLIWIACLSLCAVAENKVPCTTDPDKVPCTTDPDVVKKDSNAKFCNGISVGAPKVFDNRTLTIMLESLSEQLNNNRAMIIDQATLKAALGLQQGSSSSEFNSNFNISNTPIPGLESSHTLNTGNVDANGNPLPGTTTTSNKTSNASFTPQIPALDALPAFSGFNPNYGESANDLLTDQVNLNYQIFNLRMLLERSLSDRLIPLDAKYQTRLQAVVGFNVTLDPPRIANDAVAVVEVTVTSPDSLDGRLSLVSLLPQEKTYNASALSQKSNAYGGAVAIKAVQAGYNQRRRSQIFYLYRDTDTVAYERMNDSKQLVFGWMFRPVLGRRSVSPGMRQMFAILAVAAKDCTEKGMTEKDKTEKDKTEKDKTEKDKMGECSAKLTTEVKTYWKKYDRATMTSFLEHDANRAARFGHAFSIGLNKPEILANDGHLNKFKYDGLEVLSSAMYEKPLRPKVDNVIWRPTGAKSVIVSVSGENFFTGTQVVLGDKQFNAANGLRLQSNQSLDVTTTVDALANGPGMVQGRYGKAVALLDDSSPYQQVNARGLNLDAEFTKSLAGLRTITVHVYLKPDKTVSDVYTTAKDAYVTAKDAYAAANQAHATATAALANAKAALSRTVGGGQANDPSAAAAAKSDSEAKAAEAKIEEAKTKSSFVSAKTQYEEAAGLPLAKAPSYHDQNLQLLGPISPIVSVNGTALPFPYSLFEGTNPATNQPWLTIQATMPDDVITDGGGVVKVSWPFLPPDQWTAAQRFFDADLAFQVKRVSEKTIIIQRVNGGGFVEGADSINPHDSRDRCWKLIAGDVAQTLYTSACPAPDKKQKPAPKPPRPKGCKAAKPDCNAEPPADPILTGLYDTVGISSASALPEKAVLIAPSGAVYSIAIPKLKATEEDPKPVVVNQNDVSWIDITFKSPLDAAKGKLLHVEANDGNLPYKLPEPDKKTGKLKSVHVEITRALTAKSGSVEVTAFLHEQDAKEKGKYIDTVVGSTKIQVVCTHCNEKGEK